MRRVLLTGLTAVVAFAAACCPTTNCEEECPDQIIQTGVVDILDRKVDITVLVLPGKSVTVNRITYSCDLGEVCEPGADRMDLPDEGQFMIQVGEGLYGLDTHSPDGEPLLEVYVVADPIILGVYKDTSTIAARATCPCTDCNGVIVCGCTPTCPVRDTIP